MGGIGTDSSFCEDFAFHLPSWVKTACPHHALRDTDQRMLLAIDLARQNIDHAGGPFGAAVFDGEGCLIAAGVNLVVPQGCSVLHAEMVAIMLAQRRLARYDLSDGGRMPVELVSSAAPCAMCLGALPWAGIQRLVCGARDEDVRSVGFDEGHKAHDWREGLQTRGIVIQEDVQRLRAIDALQSYRSGQGVVYNAGSRRGG